MNSTDNYKIEDYRTMMDKFSMRMEELERTVMNKGTERITHDEARTSNTGRPYSNNLENVHEEVEALSNNTDNQAPLEFSGEDINMDRRPMNSNNQPKQPQAPLAPEGEEVNMGGQSMDIGRPKDVRWGKQPKRRKRILDDDEEEFDSLDEEDNEEDNDGDDSDPEIVSVVYVSENRVIWLTVQIVQ